MMQLEIVKIRTLAIFFEYFSSSLLRQKHIQSTILNNW